MLLRFLLPSSAIFAVNAMAYDEAMITIPNVNSIKIKFHSILDTRIKFIFNMTFRTEFELKRKQPHGMRYR